jgi:hypothetical protein
LHASVLQEIRWQIKTAANLSEAIKSLNDQKQKLISDSIKDLSMRIGIQRKEVKRLTDLKMTLYESFAGKKLLTEDEFIYMKRHYGNQLDEAKQQLECLLNENILLTETHTPQNKWLLSVQKFTEDDALTPEMINHFLLRVIVRGKDDFTFVWKLKSEYETLLEYITGSI